MLVIHVHAQPKDSLALYKKFFDISKNYQYAPMQATIKAIKSTNFINAPTDTATVMGNFFVHPQSSYMQFGEVEQFVTDSLVVMVSSNLKQIVVIHISPEEAEKYKFKIGTVLPDSSFKPFMAKYTIETTTGANGNQIINLLSRQFVLGTKMPKESIQLVYENSTSQPKEVTTIQRGIVELSNAIVAKQPQVSKFKIAIEGGNNNYYIKEQTEKYVFLKINHDANITAPVLLSARLVKTGNDEFEPAKGYEHYRISKQ
jgi:hypothetical protein